MKGVRRKCNLIINFSKIKSNKKYIEWFNITINNANDAYLFI